MRTETTPVERTVDTFLGGLDQPLQAIHHFQNKTDADFIIDGAFDPRLKVANFQGISAAIKNFNIAVTGKDIKSLAREYGEDSLGAIALSYAADTHVKIKEWSYHAPGSTYAEPMPPIHAGVEDTRPAILETVDAVSRVVKCGRDRHGIL